MAFAGMIFVAIFLALILGLIFFMLLFIILSIILKKKGKKKNSRKLKIAGNVVLVLGILCAIPVAVIAWNIIWGHYFREVTLPDETTKWVSVEDLNRMWELAKSNDTDDISELEKLINKSPELVHYLDANRRCLLEHGLMAGSFETVELALKYGATFDNPERYEHTAYVDCSMDEYLEMVSSRSITEDDLKILNKMFEVGATSDYVESDPLVYSNAFGQAVWVVLYNDESVTDLELEFLQVLVDNGLDEDEHLVLYEEKGNNISYSDSEYYEGVKKDENYEAVMKLIGR